MSETDQLLPLNFGKSDENGAGQDQDDGEKWEVFNGHSTRIKSSEEIFATLRVMKPRNLKEDAPDLEDVTPSGMESTFLNDCRNFAPGSMPHSTVVGITIGCMCGIVAYLYSTLMEFLLEWLWRTLPEKVLVPYVSEGWYWIWIPALGFTMALGVGLSVKFLGEPGDLSYTVQCVHDQAYIDMSHVLPMLAASQFSILGGGSLGPEAPLVAICASFAGYVSRSVFGQTKMNLIRKHTLMGMACALAAFFGVPLGGSLFALEVNSRFGIEYYEHTMEAIFSGTVCLCVFRGLAGLPLGAIWQIDEEYLPVSTYQTVLLGAVLGLLGAGAAAVFSQVHQKLTMQFFRKAGLLHNSKAIQRALVGSCVILFIGVLIPRTMFWGESEFQTLATGAPAEELPHVFPQAGLLGLQMNSFGTAMAVGVCKLIAISFTVAGGYRGGFIFPFFCAGAAFGKGLTYIFPSLHPSLATLSIAAGINVAITRTGLATPLILCALAGEQNAIAPVLAASMVSLFSTSYMPFIKSQVKRIDVAHLATPTVHIRREESMRMKKKGRK